MYTLFHGGCKFSPQSSEAGVCEPQLLVELPPWGKVFFRNLADLLCAPFRRETPLELTSRPAAFWPDVFVNRRLPLAPLRQSVLYHAFIIVALWGLSETWWARPPVQPRNPFENTKAVYYPVSEYLPPIDDSSGSPPPKEERKGEPAYARQRIVSLPRRPDNRSQTIITPSPLEIHEDIPLPNIVALTPTPAAVPAAMAAAVPSRLLVPQLPSAVAPPPDITRAQLNAPAIAMVTAVAPPPNVDRVSGKAPVFLPPAVVAPPPSMDQARSRTPAFMPPAVVAPAPDTRNANSHMPAVPAPAVVEPPPSTNNARDLGSLNIAHKDPGIAAPPLAVPEQRAMWIKSGAAGAHTQTAAGSGSQGGTAGAMVPPPALASGGNGAHALGQIVALGLNPAVPNGPVVVPAGNRRGEFAAGPEGRRGAAGTPEIRGGGTAEGRGGHGSGEGAGNGGKESSLAGITVGPGAVNPGPVAVAGPPTSTATVVTKPANNPNALLAALAPARVDDLARRTHPSTPPPDAPMVGDAVFGTKRYYSMTLNMPNLTSTGGSWIMRFAELHETRDPSDVTAPVATVKVDPAYPADLRRAGMEGMVVLYAVIHADGSVGEVRVLQGLDRRLDASARAALLEWHFRPATKNGTAVDLEAVVQIPFRVTQVQY